MDIKPFMPTKEHVFTQEKIACSVIVDKRIKLINQWPEDYIKNTLEYKMTGFIYSGMKQERDIGYTFKRPTFLEWLFRKPRIVTLHFEAKDILLNPPAMEGRTVRFYECNPIEWSE